MRRALPCTSSYYKDIDTNDRAGKVVRTVTKVKDSSLTGVETKPASNVFMWEDCVVKSTVTGYVFSVCTKDGILGHAFTFTFFVLL